MSPFFVSVLWRPSDWCPENWVWVLLIFCCLTTITLLQEDCSCDQCISYATYSSYFWDLLPACPYCLQKWASIWAQLPCSFRWGGHARWRPTISASQRSRVQNSMPLNSVSIMLSQGILTSCLNSRCVTDTDLILSWIKNISRRSMQPCEHS